MKWLYRTWLGRVLVIVVAILIVVRLALPYAVLYYVNKTLDELDGYSGHVEDIELQLWRGAYQIHDIVLRKDDSPIDQPLFAAETIDLSVLWRALFDGQVVADIELYQLSVNFVAPPAPGVEAQTGGDKDWRDLVRSLTPVTVSRFAVVNGNVAYYDFGAEPDVHVYLSNVDARLSNLTNRLNRQGEAVARFTAHALAMNQADVNVDGRIDPFADQPTFNFDARMLNLELVPIQHMFEAYLPFDLKEGQLDLVIELAAEDGRLDGYIKPLLHNLNIVSWQGDVVEDNDGPFRLLGEWLVGAASALFENQSEDQFATRVPISGTLENTQIGIWPTLINILSNAFVEAFTPTLESDVDADVPKNAAGENEEADSEDESDEASEESDPQGAGAIEPPRFR